MAGRCRADNVFCQTLGLKLRNNLKQLSMPPDSQKKMMESIIYADCIVALT